MAKSYIVMLLMRVIVPATLLLSIALRPFGLSLVYLLLFLLSPLPQMPDAKTIKGFRGRYLLLIVSLSVGLLLVHGVWHSVLAGFGPYGSLLDDYPVMEKIGHNLGLVSYRNIDPLMAVHFLAPELVMVGSSIIIYNIVNKVTTSTGTQTDSKSSTKHQRWPLLTTAGKYLCLFLIMFSGIMRPSITSGIYFLVFMGAATAWSLGRPLERGFAVVGRCLMAIMAVHVTTLLVYQCTWLEELYEPHKNFSRYFGLTQMVILNQTTPDTFEYMVSVDNRWGTLASPLVILLTYYVLAVETRELFKPKPKRRSHMPGLEGGKLNGSLVRGVSFHRGSRNSKEKWKSATKKVRVAYSYINSKALRGDADETTPMIRSVSPSKRWSSVRGGPSRGLRQDSTGSVVVGEDESVMSDPTLLDDIMAAVVGFFRVIVRSSYIATTIIMMAWSIMFHSWLTFVFLMWANIVWLCPNQRSVMLKTSPVLVLYAMLLLVAQYIYGMDLTEAELPSNTTAVNLSQVGLGRVVGEPCVVLMIKSLFTCMFWVTLRQRVQEINERRRAAAAGDIAAPLQLTVSTAASVVEAQREEEEKSRLLVALGAWLRAACARYWIYVVVIMLLVIGITGERMTIFRIIYMLLFLAFILMFQISWYWWRRFMYVFWITVIIYSMINLILIYIYQFDNFSKTIETYLLINERLQHDLGLEPYHPADLFVKLLTPTLFLIITIMQVHYFHHDFMVLSEQKTGSQAPKDIDSSRPSQGASTLRDDIGALSEDERLRNQSEADERSVTDISVAGAMRRSLRRKASRSRSRSRSRSVAATVTEPRSQSFRGWAQQQARLARGLAIDAFEKVFMLLELHLLKIIMVALMLLCVSDVCAMHVPIMIIISPGLLLHQRQQRLCVLLISVLISMYIMAKMVYQIDYIKHSLFDVNCTTSDFNSTVTYNNAQWMGFVKATSRRPLAVLVKGYIGVLAVITFYSLVCYRQQRKRQLGQLPSDNQKIFPNVTRTHADKDLSHCIMFLFNYGFYKFGVEITLICLMGVIGSRMDVYAVVYAVWLLLLASMRRETLRRIWGGFTAFVTFIVPVQYMIAVGFLPMYCIYYPWTGSSEQLKHLRTWLFLPYYSEEPPHALKLVFDYFLLVFATRQLRAFRVEWAAGRARSYSGGCNEENAGSDWETPKFVNPVPDFLGTVGSWLDILKRVIFLCMLWLTLAIMFMTGTNRVNLFSMGYLIGSFIFLWQGTDFYLLPKESILQWWSWLLLYNVSVVAVKTLLQIPGCIFTDIMQEHACWLVQLLGIGCVDKFAGGNIARFLKMDYSLQNSTCSVPQEDIGLAWDGVCFAFLLLQRRLFHSYYFYRVIDESKAITVLASRGAELIEELRQKQMQVQENQEGKILEKIKAKMERIKANQKKMQGALSSKEPRHHDCGDGSEHQPARNRRRAYSKRHEAHHRTIYREPTSHQKAVRSGDYYMFDDFDDTDIAVKAPGEEDSDEDLSKEMGIVKLVSTVIKTDLKSAVSMRRLRRASAPVFPAPRPHSRASTAGPNTYPQEDTGVTREVEPGPSREREREGEREGPPSDKGDRDHDRTSEIEDYVPPPEKETWFDKLKGILETVWMFMESILVSVTRHVMKYSRDYRYVSNTLSVEKKLIKERPGFGIGLREGSQMRWEPLPGALYQFRKLSDISVPEIRILAPSMERGLDASPPPPPARRGADLAPSDDDTSEHESAFSLQTTESKDVSMLEDQDDSLLRRGNNPFLKLCVALWYAVLAHTDIVCYLMVFVNQIQSATILSIPLPLMVFLWGTLTVPRPSKTFWVTMIAYTEVIVLIKSMFQFEILPWNQKAIPANMPFTAPRIIGIERKYHYALYDLMLLLIIFFHRFMLKSLGLWKESVPEVELRDDKEYPVTPEDRKMLVEGDGEEVGHKYVKLHDVDGPANTVEESGQLVSQEMAFGDAEPGPSKQSEDEHYKVNDDEEPIIAVTTNLETTYEEYYKVIFLSVKRYLRPTRTFFMRIIKAGSRVTADIYAYMFLCDFFNFLVVIFGFAAFGTHQGDGGVQTYLEDNKVPIPFLAMLILQFALIIIDRALYLRKFMLGKILFQYALIIGVHVWMFFVLPFITERTFNTLLAPPMWYMVKCIYLLLSAYQIRCGYPRRIIGNFLCKSYNFVNMVLFRLFIAVPFVFELRTLMDWIWTDTSMTLMDWLKMEDIFASVFLLKCSRYVEDEFPQARGEKKSSTSKYLLGGGVLALIITIIWFPLVFFAFGDSVGQPNPPTDVTVKIRIGPFLPVYQMSAQSHNIDQFNEQDYAQLSNLYARDRTVQTFLSAYMYNDVAVVSINPNSTMKWVISPPELERLEKEAESNATLSVKFTYVITHLTNAQNNPPVIEDNREVDLPAFVETARNKERDKLYRMLVNKATDDDWIDVKTLFPKFVKVFNKGTVRPVYQLMPETPDSLDPNERLYRDVQLRLERQNATMYWRVREKCASQETINSIPLNDCNMLVMYTFNDKLFPETLNFISGSGIIGLYTTFVLLASRVIRGFFSGIYNKIMFDDLPNVDRVLQLCLDIYLVREAVELTLEEDLFAKLVFLYRSPETMIKWTRPKEDEDDQRELQLERELDEPLPPPALRRSPRPDRD